MIKLSSRKVFISMRGLCVTWRMSWLLGYLLREVLCDIAKCPWPWKEFLSAYVVYDLLDTHYDTLFTLWCMSTKNCPCLWTRCVQFGCLVRRTLREVRSWTVLTMFMNQFGLRRQLTSLRRGCGGASEELLRQGVIFCCFYIWNMLRSNISQE